jgi:hypothetical protein
MLCADCSLVSRVRAIRTHGLNGGLDRHYWLSAV